jgi:hypothetical protein
MKDLQKRFTEDTENVHHLLEDKHSSEMLLPVGVALYVTFLSGHSFSEASRTAANDFDAR